MEWLGAALLRDNHGTMPVPVIVDLISIESARVRGKANNPKTSVSYVELMVGDYIAR